MLSNSQLDDLRAVPIPTVLASFGVHPARRQGHQLVYSSPLRKDGDSDPSFFVDPEDNKWKDFGLVTTATGKSGGNVVDLVMEVGETDFEGAVQFLLPFLNAAPPASMPAPSPGPVRQEGLYDLQVRPLQDPALLTYLTNRGIDAVGILKHNAPLRELLLQATYRLPTSANVYRNVAFRNRLGGNNVELKGQGKGGTSFTRCYGQKTYTLVPGTKGTRERLHVVEGFTDYLSLLMKVKHAALLADVLVLNSVNTSGEAAELAATYGELWLWLDNDKAGKACTEFWKTHHSNVVDKSGEYAGYKDINDWLMGSPIQPRKRPSKGEAPPDNPTNSHRADTARWWLWVRWTTPQADGDGVLWKGIVYYSYDDELPSLGMLKALRAKLAREGKITLSRLCEGLPGTKENGKRPYKVLELKEHLPQ